MNFENKFIINTTVEGNKIKFYLSLPENLKKINEDKYFELDDYLIYEETVESIDLKVFSSNLNILMDKIKVFFYDEKIIDYDKILFKESLVISNVFVENKDVLFEFIKKYKNLKLELYVENYKELIDNLKSDDYPNLKIKFKNSKEAIPYKEFYEMFSCLYEIIDFVNSYNLSPIEKIMLVYDIVKSNKYNSEKENESYGTSRDLNRIIKNDKIVCVGFANLMDFLLTNLGFKVGKSIVEYENKDYGHERNYIYLKDDKYGINNIFFLDATWDSKRDDNYLENYSCFLKPLSYFKNRNKNEIPLNLKMTTLLSSNSSTIFEYLKEKYKEDPINTAVFLKGLIEFCEDDNTIKFPVLIDIDDETLHKAVEILEKKYYSKISHETFKNALYKVRKIEYINKIIDYVPTEQYIDEICFRYYKESKLMAAIFGKNEIPTLKKDLGETNSGTIDEDLLRIRLLRTLKEKLQDFPKNDYIKKM